MKYLVLVVAIMLAAAAAPAHAADNPAQACARMVNDDTVQGYNPALQDAFVRAFHRLFPQAPMPPNQQMLEAQAHYRCMGGKLYACFIGANLPCSPLNTNRENTGATAFCEDNADADFVPMVATGHDTAYNYRCRDGKAEVTGTTFKLDARGFAAQLWTRLN